ncbi:MAG: hypothetical protein M3460_10025 [Actinomycetota bacterium]|nr:hypothetical protein [Actinomycetota bacterium]
MALTVALNGFYLPLTDLGPTGNPVLRSVYAMTQQLISSSGRDGNSSPRPRSGSDRAATQELDRDLGVRPGESDPTRMLCAVLLLVAATIAIMLGLVWWLV